MKPRYIAPVAICAALILFVLVEKTTFGEVLFIYSCESLIIGVFTIVKMASYKGNAERKTMTIVKFALIFYAFQLLFGFFTYGLFIALSERASEFSSLDKFGRSLTHFIIPRLWPVFAFILVAHFVSHYLNWVKVRKFENARFERIQNLAMYRVGVIIVAFFLLGMLGAITSEFFSVKPITKHWSFTIVNIVVILAVFFVDSRAARMNEEEVCFNK